MPDRCACHDLLVADCDRLRGAETREQQEQREEQTRRDALIESGRAIRARYPGSCAVCGDGYGVGTPITLDKRVLPRVEAYPDAPTRWVAACCLDEHGRVRT